MLRKKLPKRLEAFDAFPKVVNEYRKPGSSRGGAFSLSVGFFILLLFLLECFSYVKGVREQRIVVSDKVSELMDLNVDVTIAMPCTHVRVDAADKTNDIVMATDMLTLEETDLSAMKHSSTVHRPGRNSEYRWVRSGKFRTKKKPLTGAGSACRIYGKITVNRVHGQLHITAPGWGYGRSNIPFHALNFTHYFEELSFGDYYPAILNSLDGHYGFTDKQAFGFQYYLSILPTSYKSSFRSLETNQYSLTENSVPRQLGFRSIPPGIFIEYDIEPLGVEIVDKYPSILKSFLRVLSISGGLYIVMDWLDKYYSSRPTAKAEDDMLGLLGKEVN
ncbi:COPII-coated vesicle component Erv41 [Schizosaccharomyces cryophilus OY26]|uniref:Endoplasmic reticulum-Golgi intermediate compartment protein n=1 Tax=Schizosaccharomyces cryophilus (strain OY26 / ATCC MYA-4695 / CBS 11777 / NBRC 106824 / NRRL Y48691) TaxID=653667 RepID=S9X3D8_SCHCR|nr:COPII-coated vesicle component Erv41 [Schizosaccharomyces cryophilus OY26]EPY51622.1 COPII-coated vesicle component Erv41 [Schizosaccharomyces cryophilus OY26]